MARYTSATGKDVVLTFKGTSITIPANGYYEASGENLAAIFPKLVQKIKLEDVIQNIEKRLLPPNIKEIPQTIIKPIIEPIIYKVKPLKIEEKLLKSPVEISLPPIKEVSLKTNEREKIVEIINNSMETTNDPDLNEFLGMIRDILSSEK